MRICGKRASQFSQAELQTMMMSRKDLNGKPISREQRKEMLKVYCIRAGVRRN